MKYLKTFWIVAASLLLTACETPKEKDHSVAQKVVMDEISEDIKVPIQMWVDIETEPVGLGEKKAEASEEDSGLNRNTILFSPVTVFLSEHNPDVLTHSEIRIELPRGGGKIDLSQYIGDSAGSFQRGEWTLLPDHSPPPPLLTRG